MSDRPGDQNDEEQVEEPAAPKPRNPFAKNDENQETGPSDSDALIQTKRSAAFLGVIVGLGVLILFVLICVVGTYAFS